MFEHTVDFKSIISECMPDYFDAVERAKKENSVLHVTFDDTGNKTKVLLLACVLYAKEQGVSISVSSELSRNRLSTVRPWVPGQRTIIQKYRAAAAGS